jgi:transposase
MRIIGCDVHATQQTIAMLECESGEMVERTLKHDGTAIREFYAALPRPVVVGIEATGSMGWFLRLMSELEITCHVGHPATIRRAETRRQKHDRRDAALLLELLTQDRFPSIWIPSTELGDLRALLLHRHQWVRIRTRVMNALQGLALAHGIRRRARLWSHDGQATIASLPLPPHTAYRRSQLQALYVHLTEQIDELDQRVRAHAQERPQAARLMTHPGVGPVTALATEVFLGDPARFADGKAVTSYVGVIPSEYSSGDRQRLGKSRSRGIRCCGYSGAKPPFTRCNEIRREAGSIGASCSRKDSARRVSPWLVNWVLVCGPSCAIKSITRSSAGLRDQIDYAEFCRRAPTRAAAR